jgi:hypothetical protein
MQTQHANRGCLKGSGACKLCLHAPLPLLLHGPHLCTPAGTRLFTMCARWGHTLPPSVWGSHHHASACKQGTRTAHGRYPPPLYPLTPAHLSGLPCETPPFMHGQGPLSMGSEGWHGTTPSPSLPLMYSNGAPKWGPPPLFHPSHLHTERVQGWAATCEMW